MPSQISSFPAQYLIKKVWIPFKFFWKLSCKFVDTHLNHFKWKLGWSVSFSSVLNYWKVITILHKFLEYLIFLVWRKNTPAYPSLFLWSVFDLESGHRNASRNLLHVDSVTGSFSSKMLFHCWNTVEIE